MTPSNLITWQLDNLITDNSITNDNGKWEKKLIVKSKMFWTSWTNYLVSVKCQFLNLETQHIHWHHIWWKNILTVHRIRRLVLIMWIEHQEIKLNVLLVDYRLNKANQFKVRKYSIHNLRMSCVTWFLLNIEYWNR